MPETTRTRFDYAGTAWLVPSVGKPMIHHAQERLSKQVGGNLSRRAGGQESGVRNQESGGQESGVRSKAVRISTIFRGQPTKYFWMRSPCSSRSNPIRWKRPSGARF